MYVRESPDNTGFGELKIPCSLSLTIILSRFYSFWGVLRIFKSLGFRYSTIPSKLWLFILIGRKFKKLSELRLYFCFLHHCEIFRKNTITADISWKHFVSLVVNWCKKKVSHTNRVVFSCML